MSSKSEIALARQWIATDKNAVVGDIARLGLDEAVDYQMSLISDRAAAGDARWYDIGKSAMRTALTELAAE